MVKRDARDIVEDVMAHLDLVLMQLDHAVNKLQVERRTLFHLLMQLKGKE